MLQPQHVPSIPLMAFLQRFYNEVRMCGLLHHRDAEVVSLVGMYSMEAHPLGLDLRQYLRTNPMQQD